MQSMDPFNFDPNLRTSVMMDALQELHNAREKAHQEKEQKEALAFREVGERRSLVGRLGTLLVRLGHRLEDLGYSHASST